MLLCLLFFSVSWCITSHVALSPSKRKVDCFLVTQCSASRLIFHSGFPANGSPRENCSFSDAPLSHAAPTLAN